MAKPKWHENMWASRPALVAKLKTIDGIDYVKNLRAFKQVSDQKTRTEVPEDGTMYVIKDGFIPSNSNNNSREQINQIGYSLFLAKYDPINDADDEALEQLITRILRSLQGFEPKDSEGNHLSLTPFEQAKPFPITAQDGFTFYPFRFVTEVAVLQEKYV